MYPITEILIIRKHFNVIRRKGKEKPEIIKTKELIEELNNQLSSNSDLKESIIKASVALEELAIRVGCCK